MKCGLLGKTLGHSYSPQIHSYLGNYSYQLFEKKPEELPEFLRNGDFSGINVTIPYKKDVIPFCRELSDRARKIGAVNTIVRQSDGTLVGHNTDYFGFHSMLTRTGLSVDGKKVLVLGSGGASVTAVTVLQQLNADVVIISRSGKNNYSNLHLHSDAAVIVNTTPVGMYPHNGSAPIDVDLFPHLEGVLDLIYNPARTKLLLDAERRGVLYENGLWMLVAQAKESAEWFTNTKISDTVIAKIHQNLCRQMENIVLIGMPGCGKTTIGKMLAQNLGKRFVDSDDEIVHATQMSIPDIFSKQDESGFRQLETQILGKLGAQSGLVIATGGGCVTREENYAALHQNGNIYWIQRDIAKLATEGRPLSQSGKLEQMFAIRSPLYSRFADRTVSNDDDIDETVKNILKGYVEYEAFGD